MAHRLSKLQGFIIDTIANSTINVNDDDGCYAGGLDSRLEYITSRNLLTLCVRDFWPTDKNINSAKAAYSRALRSLVFDKGLVEGMALQWQWISKEFPEGDGGGPWQGGGRPAKVDDDFSWRQPPLKMVALTDEGWALAEKRGHDYPRGRGSTVNREDVGHYLHNVL